MLGTTIVALVAAAVFVGGRGSQRVARAEAELAELYATGDPAALRERLVPGSLNVEGLSAAELDQALAALMQGGLEVTASEAVSVRGVELVRIRTPQLDWCVRPDGQLLVGCRVASADIAADSGGMPAEVVLTSLDVYADWVEVVVVLAASGAEAVPLGDVELEGPGTFELAEAAHVTGGQRIPAEPGQLAIRPPLGVLLVWRSDDVAGLTPGLTGATFVVHTAAGAIQLEVGDVRWLIGGGS